MKIEFKRKYDSEYHRAKLQELLGQAVDLFEEGSSHLVGSSSRDLIILFEHLILEDISNKTTIQRVQRNK